MVTVQQVANLIAQLGGLAVLAGTLAAVAAFAYRWVVRERIPTGLALLVGLSGVAIYLNTTTALGQVIGGSSAPTETEVALFNIAAFLAGGAGAVAGQEVGDWFGSDVVLGEGSVAIEADVGRLVQSVGRVIAVELPENIDDIVGYDPVAAETKETLAGKTFIFPRRLTVGELRDRLVTRLKADYGVGHVDIELADDGTVEYLALGSRAAGIGPTLPPATNAVAIRADPAFAASAGDLVQVWETDPMRRVLTAELRGVAEDTVTIAIDAADTQKIDPTKQYRLVTLPVEDRPDREFASLLRAADETFSSVTVEAGSPLHGLPLAALDVTVVAVKPDEEEPTALPEPTTVLAPGDVVFAIARPEALRRLEMAAEPLDPSLVSSPTKTGRTSRSRRSVDAEGPSREAGDEQPAAEAADESDTTPDAVDEPASADADATPAADAAPDDAPTADTTADTSTEADATADADVTADAEAANDAGTEAADSSDDDFSPPAAESEDETETPAGKAGPSSFRQLKEEFESGDAEWAEETERDDEAGSDADEPHDGAPDEVAFEGDSDDGQEESRVADDSGAADALDEASEDLDGLDIGDEDAGGDDLDIESEDELDGLELEDDEDDELEELSFDEDDDDEDDDGGGGGASSFQQLKEEFESGEADWEDDISDSPGGDMRLDE